LVIDQRTALPTLLAARDGGVDFEANAGANPDMLETLALSVDGAHDDADIAGFLDRLGLSGDAAASVKELFVAAIRAFFATDASLVEINPLALTPDHRAIAVDAKMVIDGNALARHPELDPFVREAPIEESERIARENEINFIKMDGDIGMVVNGAGLGLATHDMVIDAGGRPANFMDIRTTASSFQIAKVVGLLIADPSIKVILVNIHGGGMTVCDTVAEAINFAYARSDRHPPIVYRAAGQNAPWALSIMKNRRLPFEKFDDMTGAVARAVAVAQSGAR
jgi:succinyl-CoA synthetase beta subunit